MFGLSIALLVFVLDTSLKAVVVALAAAALMKLLRLGDSNLRHRIWTGVLAGMLLLPLLTPVVPALQLPVPVAIDRLMLIEGEQVTPNPSLAGDSPNSVPSTDYSVRLAAPPSLHGDEYAADNVEPSALLDAAGPELDSWPIASAPPSPAPPLASDGPPARSIPTAGRRYSLAATLVVALVAAWIIGTALMSLRLIISVCLAWRLARLSTAVEAQGLPGVVRSSELIHVPITIGFLRPKILLPHAWRTWPADKLQVVLAHETMHIERGDCAIALLAEINCCLYWFHPLAWWLKRQLAALAEQACDDAAIAALGDRTQYARHLLEVAAAASHHRGRLVPAGLSMARSAGVEMRILSILDFTRPLSRRLTWPKALLLLALMIPIIMTAAALSPAGSEKGSGVFGGTEPAAADGEPPPKTPDPVRVSDVKDTDPTFVYSASVVDSTGKPVPGAEVRLLHWQKEPPLDKGPPAAITDSEGKFHITRRKSDFREGDGFGLFQFAQIVVTKDGFGLAARSSVHCETTGSLAAEITEEQLEQIEKKAGDKITLTPDDVPIEGRIISTEGQPVAGALVEVTAISEGKNGSLDEWLAGAKKPDADYWSLNRYCTMVIGGGSRVRAPREDAFLTAKTDESGRFTLRGLGRERIANVFISGERIETATFHVRSRPGEAVTLPWSASDPRIGRHTFYPNQFTHVVGPSQAVEGRVTDKKTGQPLAGLLVKAERVAGNSISGSLEAGYIRTLTDADGRYRLTGLPLGNNGLLVLPPEKSRYLAAEVTVATKLDEQPLARNVELAQGIMVHGHVTDSRTGKPVSGYVKYFAFSNNPHLRENREFAAAHIDVYHHSNGNDEYAIPVLPGSGILAFTADRGQHYPRGVGADEIDGPKSVTNATFFLTSPFLVTANNFNLLKGLNLKPEAEELKLDLMLASGSTFTVKLNAADGQPLSNYYVFGQYNWAGWYEGPKEQTLSVYAYLPEEGRRVMIYHPERNLVGLADITGEASPQQEIALRPGGTIHGRVIDGDGTPLEGLALYAKVRDFYGKNENSPATLKDRGEFPNQLDGQQILTDKDGRFELRGLIPGLKYTAGASGFDTMNGRRYTVDRGLIFTDETIESGQTKDLGDLRVKPIIADRKEPQAVQPKAVQSTDVAGPKADQPFTFAGSVIDHRGQPMAGASISFGYLHEKAAGTGPRLLTTTDQAGKFQFTKTRRELTGADGEAALVDAELIATKAGYGFAASAVQYFESSGSLLAELGEQDKTTIEYNHGKPSSLLTLVPDDVPIRGRLLDSEGRAVAGAKIEVATVWRGKNGDLNDWEAAASQPGADEAATGQFVRPLSFSGYLMTGDYPLAASHVLVVPPVRTDANGRFVLSGVGRDRLVQLYISGPGMATMRIDARSRRGDVLRLPNRVSYPEFGDITYYPADFTCIASPSVAVTGRLTDRATGHPVAGCVIRGEKIATSPIHGGLEAMYIHAKTDADGHYRLEGLPLGDSIVQIVPPPASSYLIANVDVKTSPSSTPQVRDVALSSGVKVRGRVTDARTGKPLSGRLAYFAFVTNPHLQTATGFDSPEFHYRSGADGRYEIPVLPGKGILAFMADNHHDYRRGVGADRIDGPKYDRPNDLLFRTEPSLCHPFNHHLLVSLDPAPDATSVDLDLSLTSGLSFTGRVRRADGQPIGKYYLYGEQAFASWHTPRSGETFEVKGYFPDEGRRLMVYHPEHNLVGWVDVTDAPPNNLEIVLRKGGVLTGRVVDADGLPLEGISLDSDWRDLKIASRYSPAVAKTWGEPITSLEGRQLLTDKEGRFELKGVIPGLQYSVRAGGTTRQFGRMQATVLGGLFTDVTANSGQIKDLGDLRIKEREVKGPAEAKADADAGREPAPAGDKASKDAEKTASSEGKPAANAATDKAKTTKPSTPAAATEFRGRIVDASSNAVSGAKIYAILSRLPDLEPLPPRLIATTNAAGEFNLALPIAPAVDPKERLGWMARERLVITAPGHGFVLTSLDQLRNQPPAAGLLGSLANAIAGGGTPTISLPKAGERIRGRLVDIDGQPVVGATVKTRWYDEIKSTGAWSRNPETKNDEKAAWQERVNHLLNVIEPVQYRDVLPEATTDAAGRFELRDLGANRLFQLLVQGERIESIELVARNQPGDEIVIPPERNYRDHEVTLYPREFTRAVGPSTPVTGRVVDFDTGEPIAGAVVRAYAIHGSRLHSSREREEFATRSSADGSYKITGLPIGKENRLAAFTLGDIPYIPVGCQADTSKPDGNRQDFRLKRGVFAEGRVYDGQTDKPFTGEIRYYWFRDRKLEQEFPGLFYAMVDERYWTNGLGEFRVPVLPARGVLAFRYSGHDRDRDGIDRFPRGGGADAIGGAEAMGSLNAFPTLPHYLMPTDYERVAEVNPQADQKTVHVDLPLYASQPVKVRVLDAEGNPVTGCEIYGANQRWGWQPKSDAEFSIEDLKADERRKVLAFHRSRNLAGGAIAKRDAEQPIEIKLAPAGTISGRLIDADGLPITDAEVHADYDKLKSGDMSGLWANHPRLISNPTHIPTDKDGRFQVEGLIPGWTYNAYATAPRKLNGQSYNSVVIGRVFKAVRIEPGENKDLGDIRVEQEKDEEPEKEKRVENTPAASSKPAPAASRAGTSAANGSAIAGRVTDAAGKPIAGAQIAAIARRSTPARGGNLQYDGEVLCEASTDDKGEYNLRLKGVSSKTHRYGSLIARAGDLAVAWKKLDLDSPQTEASFNLVQDEPIRGRLIDIEGRPAANVKFNVRSVIKTVTSGWSEEGAGYRGEKTPAAWLPPITCDSEGRFTIRGVPPGHGVHIDVEPTDLFAPQGISINTGNSESRGENDGTYRALVRNGKLGEEIVLPLSPAQIFEGTIRYEDTKQPAPHARLNIWASQQRMPGSMISVEGKADAEGHYRIHALPGIRFGVTAYPPDGAPYLVRKTDEPIQWETSERVKQVDLTLPRGVLIRGKITAAGRGTPIAGASIQYLPQASKDRRPDRTILTGWQAIEVSGDDGSFQIPVLPGPGWLVVHAGSGSYVLKEAGSSFIDYGKPGGQRYYAHAFHKIDPTAGADALDVTIELQPGASLAGQIVDEQNQPVDEAIVVSRLDIWRTSLYWRGGSPPVLGGRFQLSGLEEGVEYPTHFFDRKRSLGATVHLKAGQPPPTVVLQPCGSAVVRCVDGDGQPVADHHPTLHMVVTPGTHRYDFAGMQAGKLAADSDFITNIYQTHFDQPIPDAAGKLTLPPLIPGATYWILTSKANDGRFEIAREFQVKSGEKLNLGDVVVAKGSSKEGQLSPVKP